MITTTDRPLEGSAPQSSSCVNLRDLFSGRYKVRNEEAYYAEYGPGAHRRDPWYMILLCRCGHIYPQGGTTLAASVDGHPNIAGRLKRMESCQVHQDGDLGELTVLFDLADFDRVAKVMRPRRRPRRNLTPEQRREIGERLRLAREGS